MSFAVGAAYERVSIWGVDEAFGFWIEGQLSSTGTR
jgi:hypothetical protein